MCSCEFDLQFYGISVKRYRFKKKRIGTILYSSTPYCAAYSTAVQLGARQVSKSCVCKADNEDAIFGSIDMYISKAAE